jgi:hypothetical protein
VPCDGRRGNTQSSARTTNTPAAGSGGWRGPILPLAPSERRGVVVWNLHHDLLTVADEGRHWWNRWRGGRRSRDRRCTRRLLLQPRGHVRAAWWIRRRRHAPIRPWRSRRAPPRGNGCVQPERLGRREGGDSWRHPCEQEHQINLRPLEIRGAWGERYLPQTREAPLPLPRGFRSCCRDTRRRHRCARRRHRCARRRPRGARWCLRSVRGLLY